MNIMSIDKLPQQMQLPLPWQQNQWQHLCHLVNINRLPHALLFQGQAGLGTFSLAKYFIQGLFCKSEITACRHCKSCELIQNRTHPDYMQIDIEENASSIKIDQIRTSNHFLCRTAGENNYKVLLVNDADKMNRAAANALLKTLEEPVVKRALIILVSAAPENLLATIRSRCQTIYFPAPNAETARGWLSSYLQDCPELDYLLWMTNNSPLYILTMQQQNSLAFIQEFPHNLHALHKGDISPLVMAQKCQKEDSLFIINLLIRWHIAMLNQAFGGSELQKYLPGQHNDKLQLFLILDKLYHSKQILNKGIQLNKQLLLESIFQIININVGENDGRTT